MIMKTLTDEQISSLRKKLTDGCVAVRFQFGGETVNITTGEKTPRGTNIINQQVYWGFDKKTALEVARITGTKPVFNMKSTLFSR